MPIESRATNLGRLFCCALLPVVTLVANGAQIPLRQPLLGTKTHASLSETPLEWRFDVPLSTTNTTSNFIFDGVSSLLQQWANTRYRNGHNIVPATVPVGTLLYHGTGENRMPVGPEWVATDPEHSFLFCREWEENQGCWHLTLTVTRPLNVLYFDGSSAAKMPGCMDAQDLIVWGDVEDTPERILWGEGHRIAALCEWGRQYGLDGFMRMEPDFEFMLCDFSEKVEVNSFSHVVPGFKYRPGQPKPPKKARRDILKVGPGWPEFPLMAYRTIEAGKWHDRFPGETRVQLDLTRLVSFYDQDTFPSLHGIHAAQPRWEHRAGNATSQERERLLAELDGVLNSGKAAGSGGSGVDWASVYRVVVHRYAERLELLQYILNGTHTALTDAHAPNMDAENVLRDAHEWITTSIFPYILHGARPSFSSTVEGTDSESPHAWATPIFEKCATTHTKGIHRAEGLTSSEKLLLTAVDDVLHEICRVVVGIWAEGVELGLEPKDELFAEEALAETNTTSKLSRSSLDRLVTKWQQATTGLMEWLDWSVWVKCKPACGYEETCYIPTWPWLRSGMLPFPKGPKDGPKLARNTTPWRRALTFDVDAEKHEYDDEMYWKRPQPRCLRRMQPLQSPA